MDRLAWGGGHWAPTSVSLLGGHGKVWQQGVQSCCLSGPQPAQDRALQRGCGWRFPWKASPEWLWALRGQGRGDMHLKLAKVGGGGLARPCEASQVGRSRGAQFQRGETKSKGAHQGQLPPLCSAGGVGLRVLSNLPRPGRGSGVGARWRTWHRAAVSLALILTLVCPLRSDQGAVVSPKRTPGLTKVFFKPSPCSAPSLRGSCAVSTRGRPFHRPDHLAGGGPRELHFADGQPKPRPQIEGCRRLGAHLTSGPPRDIAGRGRARQGPLGVDRASPASPAQRAPCKICLTVCWPSTTGLHK